MFVASKHYKVLCKDTCYHVKNIKPQNRVEYASISDAERDGYRLCKDCFKQEMKDARAAYKKAKTEHEEQLDWDYRAHTDIR